jgi:hypothetical protein
VTPARTAAAVREAVPALVVSMPELPSRDLSPNGYHGLGQWAQTAAMDAQRDVWLVRLRQAMLPPFPRFEGRVDIAVTVSGTGYRMDTDAWVLNRAWKALLDVLTDPKGRKAYGYGILPDDTVRHVRSFRVNVEPEGDPMTRLEITPAQGG